MWKYNYSTSDELCHYGVLGMKWGVRKSPSLAYAKATRKKNKLESKAKKYDAKALGYEVRSVKKEKKARRKGDDSLYDESRKLYAKSVENKRKSAKTKYKADKWQSKMDKAFAEYSINKVPQASIDAGRNFIQRVLYDGINYEVTPFKE